jgi:hypothetical protein
MMGNNKNAIMRNVIYAGFSLLFFLSCNNKDDANKFSLAGEIKNLPEQQVYLDEIYFGNK